MSTSDTLTPGDNFESFDPNVGSKQQPIWGIYDGHRFRTYGRNQRGHAINAFHQQTRCKIYEYENGRWVLRGTKDKRPPICDLCFVSVRKPNMCWDYKQDPPVRVPTDGYYNSGKHVFERYNGKIKLPLSLLFLCDECRHGMGA